MSWFQADWLPSEGARGESEAGGAGKTWQEPRSGWGPTAWAGSAQTASAKAVQASAGIASRRTHRAQSCGPPRGAKLGDTSGTGTSLALTGRREFLANGQPADLEL